MTISCVIHKQNQNMMKRILTNDSIAPCLPIRLSLCPMISITFVKTISIVSVVNILLSMPIHLEAMCRIQVNGYERAAIRFGRISTS